MSERAQAGAIVAAVGRGPAWDAGIRAGDRIVAVDGVGVRDVIDWRWLTDAPEVDVTFVRDGTVRVAHLARDYGEPLNVAFASPIFDGIRECENACIFCFVSQLPPGLRPSLYVRDDDVRLSFLAGNFVTLTNVDEEDVERIVTQHLSPLHVSVHAVDPGVRSRLMCPAVEDRALEVLDVLLAAGIEIHAQVVLVPGVNDGAVLDGTLDWLACRPGVRSVGLVPMGYTAHQSRWTRSFDTEGARLVLEAVAGRQAAMRSSRGVGWVYAADEFYLLAGREFPPAADYDGFPQYENGIGMVRAFADELVRVSSAERVTLVTGTLFGPVLRALLAGAGGEGIDVLEVPNRLFGGNVSVAGLLGGADLCDAIRAHGGARTYLVPDVVVNSDGLLLDGIAAEDLPGRTGADVRLVGSDAGSLVAALDQANGRTNR
jgi:putative radical SAM enzyme (TIGR03279 family)